LVLTGISGGLATSAKLTGVISMIYFIALILSVNIRFKKSFWTIVFHMLLSCYISVGVFVGLHPFLWHDPVQNAVNMINYWNQLNVSVMQIRFPYDALRTVLEKIHSIYRFVFAYDSNYGNFSLFQLPLYVPIDLILFLIGICFSVSKFLKTPNEEKVRYAGFLLWVGVFILVITLKIPLAWDRYYLPLVLVVTFVQALVLSEGCTSALRYFKKQGNE